MSKKIVSVCIATYNGEKYIEEQLNSILPQLNPQDEIIIVDDKSSDNTVKIVQRIVDSRIKLFENDRNHGVNTTFEKAISLSTGDIIFLSDQDDIWIKGRTQLMSNTLKSGNKMLVSSNFDCFNNLSNRYKIHESKIEAKHSEKHFKNIIDIFIGKPNYFGCAMAIKKDFIPVILPFPPYIESHDLWIAMAANLMKSNIHINDLTLHRRIHGNNVSVVSRNLCAKIMSRLIFVISIMVLLKRIIFKK